MSYEWAHWLREALEADVWVRQRTIFVPGWESRGRGPELGFSFNPSGKLNHHTGCFARDGHDPQTCANLIIAGVNGTPGPISQLLLTWNPPGTRLDRANPDPRIMVLAAGRANHAGTGAYRWGAPEGNGSSIGMEQCGPGPWPDICIELQERVDAAISRNRGWSVEHFDTHAGYDNDSGKWDPAGSNSREPGISEMQTWNPDLMRLGIALRLKPPPPEPTPTPEPPEEDDDMGKKSTLIDTIKHENYIYACWAGGYKTWIPGKFFEAHKAVQTIFEADPAAISVRTEKSAELVRAFGHIEGPVPPGRDPWGTLKSIDDPWDEGGN